MKKPRVELPNEEPKNADSAITAATPARSPAPLRTPFDTHAGAGGRRHILIAFALHGLILFMAKVVPIARPLVFHDDPLELVEIDVPETPRVKENPESATDQSAPGSVVPRAERARRESARGSTDPRNPGDREPTGEPNTGPDIDPLPNDDGYDDPETDWGPPIGPNGPRVWSFNDTIPQGPPAPPAPTTTPKRIGLTSEKVEEIVMGEVRAKDKSIGLTLPAAGNVRSAVEGAVFASDVPPNSNAQIVVTLGADGNVKNISVVSMSAGSAASWNAVAQAVRAQLAAQKLAMSGDFVKGAIITLNVQSKVGTPSGAVYDGPKLSATQTFDISDIGAKSVRTVRAPFSITPIK